VHLSFQLLPFAPSVGRSGTCLSPFSVSVRIIISLTSTERQGQHHAFSSFLTTIFGFCSVLVPAKSVPENRLSGLDPNIWWCYRTLATICGQCYIGSLPKTASGKMILFC
jgi:hypothetical protein